MKHSITVSSLGASVLVCSDHKSDIEKISKSEFLRRYIPNVELSNGQPRHAGKLQIERAKSDQIKVSFPQAIYNCRKFNEKDVVSLAEFLLERLRQELGLYCIHGSACQINNHAVIIWGSVSGLGKTSLCQYLSAHFGAVWFADEKIVIDFSASRIAGWVDSAYLKNGKFKRLKPINLKSIPISYFVCPIIIEGVYGDHTLEVWSSDKFFWHLFEELNRKIRGTSRLFFNGTEPIMSLDDQGLARERVKLIRGLTRQKKCYVARGGLDKVSQKLIELKK